MLTAIAGLVLTPAGALCDTGGTVPSLDIDASCHDVATMDVNRGVNFESCMKDERSARDELRKEWGSYSAALQDQCLHLVTPPALPSYITLRQCLHMDEQARQLPPESPQNRYRNRQ